MEGKYFVIVSALILVLFSIQSALGAPAFNLILVSQTPYPVEPGQNMKIEVELQNTGTTANNMVLEMVVNDPFELLPGENRIKSFTEIRGGDSVKATYNMKVDDSAISGDYDIDFRIYNDVTPSNYLKKEISINIQGIAKLVLGQVTTDPSEIEPGGTVGLNILVRNVGTGDATQLEAELTSGSENIVPVLSGGLIYVGDLPAGKEKAITLRFNVEESAEYKTYTSTLTLKYMDEGNVEREDRFDIGIPVKGKIILDIIKIEPDFERNRLEIEIANKGTADAKSLESKLVIGGEIVGVEYTSQLKATKKTTLTFPLQYNGNAQLVMVYKGPNLVEREIVKDIVLDFDLPSSGSGIFTVIFVIVVIVLAYIFWKRFFRKSKNNTQI